MERFIYQAFKHIYNYMFYYYTI